MRRCFQLAMLERAIYDPIQSDGWRVGRKIALWRRDTHTHFGAAMPK